MIIGTAGHIDHGKSALVRALTGKEMDRLAEERRRGITIDLNFAPLRFPGLPPVGVVDVPGHEDFVRTMVAGASGIDLVLLVIDAREGAMPQTLEHLAIVEQLGVPRGIPVLTKCDLVDTDWLDLIEAECAPRLAESPVDFMPPARVSAVTGEGVDALRSRLQEAVEASISRRPVDQFRMPVDRAFSLAGVGTVLTGTVWSGGVSVGDAVRLLPSGHEGRVRSVASHGEVVAQGVAATRVAVGVAGVERGAVHRGESLVAATDPWHPSHVLDVHLRLLPDAPRPLASRSRVRVHLGTAECMARVHPRGPILPGGSGLARLSLESPMLARGQDRFVIRSYSPVTTIGGGVVLDPLPPRRVPWTPSLAAAGEGERLLALLNRRPAGVPATELSQLLGIAPAEADRLAARTSGVRRVGTRWVESERVRSLERQAVTALEEFHAANPGAGGLSLGTLRQGLTGPESLASAALESLQKRGEVEVSEGLAQLRGFQSNTEGVESTITRLAEILEDAGLAPPSVAELATLVGQESVEAPLKVLARQERAERVLMDRYFSSRSLALFVEAVTAAGAAGEITPATLRERLGISRKFLIPLLEWADRKGITRREGDVRVLVVRS